MTNPEILKLNVLLSSTSEKYDENYKTTNKISENSLNCKISQKENYKMSKKKKENQLKKIDIPEFKNTESKNRNYSNINSCKSNYLSLHKLLQENSLFI